MLALGVFAIETSARLLVQDSFMRGVLVDEDEPATNRRKEVAVVELPDGDLGLEKVFANRGLSALLDTLGLKASGRSILLDRGLRGRRRRTGACGSIRSDTWARQQRALDAPVRGRFRGGRRGRPRPMVRGAARKIGMRGRAIGCGVQGAEG